jgi:hypothetical protein
MANDTLIKEGVANAEDILREREELTASEKARAQIPEKKPLIVPKEVDVPSFDEFVAMFFPGMIEKAEPPTKRQRVFSAISEFFTAIDPQLSQEATERAKLRQQKQRAEFDMVMDSFTQHLRGIDMEAESDRANARILNKNIEDFNAKVDDITKGIEDDTMAAILMGVRMGQNRRRLAPKSTIPKVNENTRKFLDMLYDSKDGLLTRPSTVQDIPEEDRMGVTTLGTVKKKDLIPDRVPITGADLIDLLNGPRIKAWMNAHNVHKEQVFAVLQANHPEAISPALTFNEWWGDEPMGDPTEGDEPDITTEIAGEELKLADIEPGTKATFEEFPFHRGVHTEEGYLDSVFRQTDNPSQAYAALILNAFMDGDVTRAVLSLGQPSFRMMIEEGGGSIRDVMQLLLQVANPAAGEE